jgi:glycosyltransferase domain-containing protein
VKTSRLTIVLPLKGRHLFTLRFLWHANKARLPYHFLIADGEAHSELTKLLENSQKTFPELDVEYIRYPEDIDFQHYYAKMADALGRVRTPYVKIADNDDFLAYSGLDCCIEFLDRHADYVCCSGRIAGFSLHAPRRAPAGVVTGRFNKLTSCFGPRDQPVDFNSQSAIERVFEGARNTWGFYAVFRTSALTQIWKEAQELSPTNLQLQERFLVMRALTLGKARCEASICSYWRQYWTSLQLHWTSAQSATRRDMVYYLLRSRFTEDISNVLDRISRSLAELDGGNPAQIADRLRELLEDWVRDLIRLDFGAYATLRRYLRAYAPGFVAWLKTRWRLAFVFERRKLLNQLRIGGASEAYIDKFKHELAIIEEALTGPEFRKFLSDQALAFR